MMRHPLSLASGVIVVVTAGLLAWDRWAPFHWPELPPEICETLELSSTTLHALNFDRGSVQRRQATNGVRVRMAGGEDGLQCLTVISRADCSVAGPALIQAISADQTAYFAIADGRVAELRAHRGEIQCGLRAPS